MDYKLIKQIRQAISSELVRKSLIEYFLSKEIPLTSSINPPVISDMEENLPQLSGYIEVQPHVVESNPKTAEAKVGWNLFVLGVNRKFIGYSKHSSYSELSEPMNNQINLEKNLSYTTVEEVIEFIVDTFEEHNIIIDADPAQMSVNAPMAYAAKIPSQAAYYDRNKSVGNKLQ